MVWRKCLRHADRHVCVFRPEWLGGYKSCMPVSSKSTWNFISVSPTHRLLLTRSLDFFPPADTRSTKGRRDRITIKLCGTGLSLPSTSTSTSPASKQDKIQ